MPAVLRSLMTWRLLPPFAGRYLYSISSERPTDEEKKGAWWKRQSHTNFVVASGPARRSALNNSWQAMRKFLRVHVCVCLYVCFSSSGPRHWLLTLHIKPTSWPPPQQPQPALSHCCLCVDGPGPTENITGKIVRFFGLFWGYKTPSGHSNIHTHTFVSGLIINTWMLAGWLGVALGADCVWQPGWHCRESWVLSSILHLLIESLN